MRRCIVHHYVFFPGYRYEKHRQHQRLKALRWLCLAYLLTSFPLVTASLKGEVGHAFWGFCSLLLALALLVLVGQVSTDDKYMYTFSILPEKKRVVMEDAGANVCYELFFDDIAAIKVFDSSITCGYRMSRGANRLKTLHGKFILLERRHVEAPDASLDADYLWQDGQFIVSYSDEVITALCAATSIVPQHK